MDLSDTQATSPHVTQIGRVSSSGVTGLYESGTPSKDLQSRVDSNRNYGDSNLDDADLLEERKKSQIQNLLQSFKKLDTLTELYKSMADDSSQLKQYERETYLGKPPDQEHDRDQVVVEEVPDDISNVSKDPLLAVKIKEEKERAMQPKSYNPLTDNAFLVEEYDLLLQYVAGTEPIKILHEKMDIKNDIQRLTELYLDANTKFKLSMPSENVENLLYEKIVYNICQQQMNSADPAGSNSFRASTQMQSVQGSMAVPFGSIYSDKQFNNKSSSALMSESSSSFSVGTGNSSQLLQNSNRSSAMPKNSNSTKVGSVTIRSEEKKIEQCTPYIVRMDLSENKDSEIWQNLVDELRTNAIVTADILQLILDTGFNQNDGFDLSHRTMLVNLTQFYFDNIYQDDRLAYAETNLFLRIFAKFARQAISPDNFYKDQIGQIQLKSEALRQFIMCLFEGITRKIPAFNYLRFVYAGPFNRVNMYQMDQDIRRQEAPQKPANDSTQKPQQKGKEPENKPGFIKKIWGSLFDSKQKEIKKEEPKKQKGPIKEGDMDFEEESKEENKVAPALNGAPPRLFSAMTQVYGGVADPFELNSSNDKDPTNLKRFEAIEQRIQEERVNSHKLVCQDKRLNYKPQMHNRIIMTEDEIRRQFENRASVMNKNEQPRASAVKTKKDLTYYIKSLVQKNFEQMINFQQKIPFAIRALLRIIIMRSRGITNFNERISVESHEVALLSQILIGGWLNTGQRNPKCFGIQPTVEKELELEFIFFQAARITFEHLMMMQRIPDEKKVDGFSVFQLNDLIKELSPQVFLFWIRLINVDISEVEKLPQESLIQQSIIRVKDLELLYTYCEKTYNIFKNIESKDPEVVEKRAPFNAIMEKIEKFGIQIDPEEDTSLADQIIFDSNNQKEKPALVKPNRFQRPMSDYFQNLINLWNKVPTPFEQYEYFLLFMRNKNDQNLQSMLKEELNQTKEHMKASTQNFVAEHLIVSSDQKSASVQSQILGPNEQSPAEQLESPLPRILQSPTPNLARHQQSVPIPETQGQNKGLIRLQSVQHASSSIPRLVKLEKITEDQISIEKGTQIVINIFNTLKMLIRKKELVIETLKDTSSTEDLRDLVDLFIQAAYRNFTSSSPDLYLQAGCQHLAFLIRKLNLEKQFNTQNQLIRHFCQILSYQQDRFKKLYDFFTISIYQFGSDVFRFEQNITSLKQFHKKFDNQLTFNKTISRYNPEVCLLSHSYELLDDFRYYKGVLLNLSCSNHQTGLPISSYMLFGVVRRSVAGVLDQPIASGNGQQQQNLEQIIISEDDLNMKRVRDQRVSRYRDHHMAYTTVTVSLQNNNTMEIKPKDEPIKLIEAFIQFYTNKQKNNLRAMIRADEEKYKAILPLDMVDLTQYFTQRDFKSDKEKYQVISMSEPFDYMNLLHTYIMFLQHISVMSSQNPRDDYIKEQETKVKQHYDFLRFDLQARTLRFSIHDYIMRRLHKTIFNQTKPFPKDELVQQLILAKQNDPGWVLTSSQSIQNYNLYLEGGKQDVSLKPKDFTDMPEWTNTHIYSSSLKTLLKIIDEETPHLKALYIDDAQACAIHSLRIASPYTLGEKYDAELQGRVTRHLMVEVCKIYDKAKTNSRLYSQLMFIHLFNIPVQENVNWKLLEQNSDYMVNELMSLKDQHNAYTTALKARNVAYEMFGIINELLREHYINESLKADKEEQDKKQKKK